ncbi:hypothetical protein GJ744_006403 [Endocarpon pusillum]|uniref:Uncharacterized protein n=1 Tax=Endocarpon pusillum TaxID=364733 RepID=A0A8H7AM33_9EURO|nr:hypothetical protein GJ744_006403 [Endocarpon pusillum]
MADRHHQRRIPLPHDALTVIMTWGLEGIKIKSHALDQMRDSIGLFSHLYGDNVPRYAPNQPYLLLYQTVR